MRWPWQRERKSTEAAERKLADVEARDPEINDLADRLDALRRANRFALMIEQALREHR